MKKSSPEQLEITDFVLGVLNGAVEDGELLLYQKDRSIDRGLAIASRTLREREVVFGLESSFSIEPDTITQRSENVLDTMCFLESTAFLQRVKNHWYRFNRKGAESGEEFHEIIGIPGRFAVYHALGKQFQATLLGAEVPDFDEVYQRIAQ